MGVIRGMRDAGIGGYASSAELLIALEGEMNASASKKERGSAGCRQRRDFPVSPVDASSEPFKNTATSRSLFPLSLPPSKLWGRSASSCFGVGDGTDGWPKRNTYPDISLFAEWYQSQLKMEAVPSTWNKF